MLTLLLEKMIKDFGLQSTLITHTLQLLFEQIKIYNNNNNKYKQH